MKKYEIKHENGYIIYSPIKRKTAKKVYKIKLKCRYIKEHLKRLFYKLLGKEYIIFKNEE